GGEAPAGPSWASAPRQPSCASMMAPVMRRSMAPSSTTRTESSVSAAVSERDPGSVVMIITSSGGQIAVDFRRGQLHPLDLLLQKSERLFDAVEVTRSTHVLEAQGRFVRVGSAQTAERALERVGA